MFQTDAEKAQERKFEEKLYNEVAKELHQSKKHDATWARALATAKGDNGMAQGLYIEYRVQSMKDDFIIQQENQRIKIQHENEKVEEVARKVRVRQGKKVLDGLTAIIAWIFLVITSNMVFGFGLSIFMDINQNKAFNIALLVSLPIATFIVVIVNKNINNEE